jgi:hypothetical protein
MILKFATKRDISGNRYYLMIDTEKKIFSRQPHHWFSREDFTEVTKTDKRRLIETLEKDGYNETYEPM